MSRDNGIADMWGLSRVTSDQIGLITCLFSALQKAKEECLNTNVCTICAKGFSREMLKMSVDAADVFAYEHVQSSCCIKFAVQIPYFIYSREQY